MESKVTHFMYVPFTGLGLYNGHRGRRWLRNRIAVFERFVVPSLLAQTSQDFKIWLSWRPEDRNDQDIAQLHKRLCMAFPERVVMTFHGICFWDDKYPQDEARKRLERSLSFSLRDLVNSVGDAEQILLTIQPSDDCYRIEHVARVQQFFRNNKTVHAQGYQNGYIMNYATGELSEYNPKTSPPFYTIRYTREQFIDPMLHLKFTGPYESHEYVPDKIPMVHTDERGFVVGTHGENISTYYDHPFRGREVDKSVLAGFGLQAVSPISLNKGLRRWILQKLPHPIRRKLRYWIGERFWAKFHDFIRR